MSGHIVWILFLSLYACAAISDFLKMTIPNTISVALVALFIVYAPFSGLGPVAFFMHGAAALAMFILCFAAFAAGMMGGGDAKLLTATALWFGFSTLVMNFLLVACLIGLLLAALLLAFRRWRPLPAALAGYAALVRLHTPDNGIPFAIAIAGAVFLVAPDASVFNQI